MTAASTGNEQARRFSSPEEEALLTLMRSADCLHRAMEQTLRPHGITANQYNVLRILRGAEPDGLRCAAIGRAMITPEPDITRLLGRLKTQKLICQKRDGNDRRVVWTRISPEGLSALARLDCVVDQAPRRLLGKLTAAELGELTRLLRKAQSCSGDGEMLSGAAGEAGVSSRRHSPRSSLLPHRPE